MKNKWKEMTSVEKAIHILEIFLTVVSIVLLILRFVMKDDTLLYYLLPLLGIDMCISAFFEWNKDRDSAAIRILLAFLTLSISIVIWL